MRIAVLVAAVACAWFLLGWVAARMSLILWREEFGEYDGGVGLAVFLTTSGPFGLIPMSFEWIWRRGRTITASRAARFWGLR